MVEGLLSASNPYERKLSPRHRRAGFCSDQCPEGFVAVAKSSLRILMVERLGEAFNQTAVRLRYTPRAFALDAVNRSIYVAEADHAAVPLAERPDAGGAAPMEDGPAGPQVPPPPGARSFGIGL